MFIPSEEQVRQASRTFDGMYDQYMCHDLTRQYVINEMCEAGDLSMAFACTLFDHMVELRMTKIAEFIA